MGVRSVPRPQDPVYNANVADLLWIDVHDVELLLADRDTLALSDRGDP